MQVGYLESRELYVKLSLSQNKMIYIQKVYLDFLVAHSIASCYEGAYAVYTILGKTPNLKLTCVTSLLTIYPISGLY